MLFTQRKNVQRFWNNSFIDQTQALKQQKSGWRLWDDAVLVVLLERVPLLVGSSIGKVLLALLPAPLRRLFVRKITFRKAVTTSCVRHLQNYLKNFIFESELTKEILWMSEIRAFGLGNRSKNGSVVSTFQFQMFGPFSLFGFKSYTILYKKISFVVNSLA